MKAQPAAAGTGNVGKRPRAGDEMTGGRGEARITKFAWEKLTALAREKGYRWDETDLFEDL